MTNKYCPFQQALGSGTNGLYIDERLRYCDGEKCQIWVKLVKDRILVTGPDQKMVDPDAEYHYEGCGLVTAIPWILVNKVKPKSESEKKIEKLTHEGVFKR